MSGSEELQGYSVVLLVSQFHRLILAGRFRRLTARRRGKFLLQEGLLGIHDHDKTLFVLAHALNESGVHIHADVGRRRDILTAYLAYLLYGVHRDTRFCYLPAKGHLSYDDAGIRG